MIKWSKYMDEFEDIKILGILPKEIGEFGFSKLEGYSVYIITTCNFALRNVKNKEIREKIIKIRDMSSKFVNNIKYETTKESLLSQSLILEGEVNVNIVNTCKIDLTANESSIANLTDNLLVVYRNIDCTKEDTKDLTDEEYILYTLKRTLDTFNLDKSRRKVKGVEISEKYKCSNEVVIAYSYMLTAIRYLLNSYSVESDKLLFIDDMEINNRLLFTENLIKTVGKNASSLMEK